MWTVPSFFLFHPRIGPILWTSPSFFLFHPRIGPILWTSPSFFLFHPRIGPILWTSPSFFITHPPFDSFLWTSCHFQTQVTRYESIPDRSYLWFNVITGKGRPSSLSLILVVSPTVNRGSVHRMRPFCGEECASESVIHTEYEHDIFTFY